MIHYPGTLNCGLVLGPAQIYRTAKFWPRAYFLGPPKPIFQWQLLGRALITQAAKRDSEPGPRIFAGDGGRLLGNGPFPSPRALGTRAEFNPAAAPTPCTDAGFMFQVPLLHLGRVIRKLIERKVWGT